MIVSAYSLIGPYYDVIDIETGEKLKGVELANSKTGKLVVLKPNDDPKSQDEYAVDKKGGYIRIEIYRDIDIVRNISYLGMFGGIFKSLLSKIFVPILYWFINILN